MYLKSHGLAIPKIPERNAQFAGLVGKVVLDACAGEDHKADRQGFEQKIVSLEGRGLLVPVPVREIGRAHV